MARNRVLQSDGCEAKRRKGRVLQAVANEFLQAYGSTRTCDVTPEALDLSHKSAAPPPIAGGLSTEPLKHTALDTKAAD